MSGNEHVFKPGPNLTAGDYEPGAEGPTVIPGGGDVSPTLPTLPDVELPFTGLSLWPLVLAGFMLVAFGGLLRRGWVRPIRRKL